MPQRRRRHSPATEHLHVRLTPNEKEALWHAADTYDLDISAIIRAWIHEKLPVRPDPNSNIRQMPLIGTHLAEVRQQPDLRNNGEPSARLCSGRSSDPTWICHLPPHQDYPQCRGCYIADSRATKEAAAAAEQLQASTPTMFFSELPKLTRTT